MGRTVVPTRVTAVGGGMGGGGVQRLLLGSAIFVHM